ncbi:general stress protein [Actinomycetospora chiangmaiensis]|uniref:general stress protein n=1 Tax=Actinomycetospora chiangmaiensis TaxID=402650 RepID=UPI00047745AD|nr:general stress protein [Actinomycetospora chiangmaiensis]
MTDSPSPVTAPPERPAVPSAASRRSIGSFPDYAAAEQAVDALSDRGFPVHRVAIVGRDLELVEQVTGRLDYPRAALRGAAGGAVTGALLGWLFGLFSWIVPLIGLLLLTVYGLIFGAVVGAVLGLLVHALQGGRRDFASVTAMRPARYEVMVDEDVADDAVRLLGWDR